VNDEAATGFDIAEQIVSLVKSSSEIKPVKSRDLPNAGPIRSASEVLVSIKGELRSGETLFEIICKKNELDVVVNGAGVIHVRWPGPLRDIRQTSDNQFSK